MRVFPKTALTLTGIILLTTQALATSPSIEPIKNNDVWLGAEEDVDEYIYNCSSGIRNVKLAGRTLRFDHTNNKSTTDDFNSPQNGVLYTGDKELELECNSGKTVVEDLEIRKIKSLENSVPKISVNRKAYADSGVNISLDVENGPVSWKKKNFRIDSNDLNIQSLRESGGSYFLYLNARDSRMSEFDLDIIRDGQVIRSESMDLRIYNWRVDVKDSPSRETEFHSIEAGKPLYRMEIDRLDSLSQSVSSSNLRIKAVEVKNGASVRNVTNDLEGFKLKNKDSYGDRQVYELIPTSEAINNIQSYENGVYKLKFYFKSPNMFSDGSGGEIGFGEFELHKKSLLKGKVTDSSGSGIETKISFDGNSSLSFNTDRHGSFKQALRPSNYNKMTLEFYRSKISSPSLNIWKPELNLDGEEGQNVFRALYSNSPKDKGINPVSVEPLSLAAFKFGYSFESAEAVVPFPAKSDNIFIYECDEWIFAKKQCSSSWRNYDSMNDKKYSIDLTTPKSNFWNAEIYNVSSYGGESEILMNAYIIGKKPSLELADFNLSSEELFKNEKVDISGKVVSSDGQPVSNVTVKGSMYSKYTSQDFSSSTDRRGVFETEVHAVNTGNFSFRISSTSGDFDNFNTTVKENLEVSLERSIEVVKPRKSSLYIGKSEKIDIGLRNSGQEILKNAELELNQINGSVYETGVTDFPSIPRGQTKQVKTTLNLPPDTGDTYEFIATASAKTLNGKEIRDSEKIVLKTKRMKGGTPISSANKLKQESSDEEPEEAEDSGITGSFLETESFSGLTTGNSYVIAPDFVSSQSGFNAIMGFLTLIFASLAFLLKYEKNSGGKLERPSLISSPSSTDEDKNDGSGDHGYVCEETGKEFDTKEGLELHKELNGIES